LLLGTNFIIFFCCIAIRREIVFILMELCDWHDLRIIIQQQNVFHCMNTMKYELHVIKMFTVCLIELLIVATCRLFLGFSKWLWRWMFVMKVQFSTETLNPVWVASNTSSKIKRHFTFHFNWRNILLTKDRRIVKLCNFGLGRKLQAEQSQVQTFAGTEQYLAPECFNGEGYRFESDVWSLGCVLYELIMMKPAVSWSTPTAE
jgi:serine/threonine protein kinase